MIALYSELNLERACSSMPEVTVEAVTTRADQKAFLQLAWDIYRDDPNWICPLEDNICELVGFKSHPIHDEMDIQPFLAKRDGKSVGRITAIVNPAHTKRYNDDMGFFGFFECIDDQEVADRLFDTAKAWLKSKGCKGVRGPTSPSLNYECGLLVDGFDTPPFFMMTYNPPYYEQLIKSQGFEKSQDLYSFWGHIEMLESLDDKLEFVTREAKKRFNIHVRKMDRSRFLEEVKMFLDIYNQSLVGTWGFAPLSEGEVEHIAKSLRHLIVPELTTVAEVDGRPVGAVFALLDYNPRIKKIRGKLFPFGFLRLLWNRRKITKIRVISTNVIPEYQKWGVGLVLLNRLVPDVLKWGVTEAEFSWVLESNNLSRKSLQKGGAKLTKTYRIYDLALD